MRCISPSSETFKKHHIVALLAGSLMNVSSPVDKIRRVLLIASPQMRRTPAFARACWLAGDPEVELTISLTAYDPEIARSMLRNPQLGLILRDRYLAARRSWLDEEADLLRSRGLKVAVKPAWCKYEIDQVLADVAAFSPDIVIKDAYHEPYYHRIAVRPLDWPLLYRCPVPLLLVSSSTKVAPRVVVAAVDVSNQDSDSTEFSRNLVREAKILAADAGAKLHLAYVFTTPLSVTGDLFADVNDAILALDRKNLEALRLDHGIPPEQAHFLVGSPVDELIGLIDQMSADVLAVGACDHRWFDRLVLGSTTEALLERSPCDVLSMRTRA